MRGFTLHLAIFVLALVPGATRAENVALILDQAGLSPFFQSSETLRSDLFSGPLTDAGFTIVTARRRDAGAMRRAAQEVRKRLDAGGVERLLIVVTGPFAGNARDNWALSNDAIGASSITVGATGLSVNALADMAQEAGRGAMMLLPGAAPKAMGSGLEPGLGDVTSVGDVTYIIGGAEALAKILSGGLLAEGVSYADLAARLPAGVRMAGHIPSDAGFMGMATGTGDARMQEAGYWQAVRDMDMIEGYRMYLRAYPGGANAAQAKERITYLLGAPLRQARSAESELRLSEAARKGIQTDLQTLGLYAFAIDGRLGEGSRAAIGAWQRRAGFEETGFVTDSQLVALREDAKMEAERRAREETEAAALQSRRDAAYWSRTGEDGTEPGLRAYLERYPAGDFAEAARAGLARLEARAEANGRTNERRAWDAARAGDTPEDYIAFLEAWPDGRFADRARMQLDAFRGVPDNQADIARAQAEEDEDIAGSGFSRLGIERRLEEVGAEPGPVDGRFDAQTREAVVGHFEI